MISKLQARARQYEEANKVKEMGLYSFFREICSEQSTEVTVQGKKVLMFGSNSYLGLTTHPKVKEAALAAIQKYGSSASGSRFLNGTTDLHNELESRLAKFIGKEAVLLYSTGFQVNIGVIPALTRKDDVVLLDRLNHASIIEGARLSAASSVIFRHNDMRSLEKKLEQLGHAEMRLIIVDGIFSMEGDIANLPEIVKLAKKYDAQVMTDCAHSMGVLGKNGAGTPSHFNLTDQVDLIGGTFSKSFASLGGFIASDADTIDYLRHHSRALIFSASMTPASVASALAALDIMESDDALRQQLWANTRYALDQFRSLGFDVGHAETPIIPLYIRDNYKTYQMTTALLEKGVFVNSVVAPAVAPQDSLIRFSLMATHTREQIDRAIHLIYEAAKALNIPLSQKAA